MRKTITRMALAAVAVLLLGACSQINERLDDLEKQIDGIENETIKDISGQVSAINQSIADLGSIRSSIQSLTSTVENQGSDVEDLKSADEALGGRIDELTSYVNDTLKAYATTEWVNATFSTLAQYEETCDTIAKIDARIGTLDTRLSGEIAAAADSLKSWINVHFGSYYTAAQMDAKLEALQAEIDSTDAENKAKADSIAAELAETKAAVDSAKANIRAEYRKAVDTAITALDGKLSKALQDSIASVNGRIDNLASSVETINRKVDDLIGRVDKLEKMIQSVRVIPAYSDGSVEVKDGILFIGCIVSPADAVKSITKDSVKLLINTVKTKAVSVVTVDLADSDIFEKDETNGTISVRANIADQLPSASGNAITVAVKVQNGISKYTTDFVPVNIIKSLVAPDGFVDLGIIISGKPLYWATCNLGATQPQENGGYYAWGATELAYEQISGDAFIFKDSRPDSYVGNGWHGNTGGNTFEGFSNEDAPYHVSGDANYNYIKYTTGASGDALTSLEASDDAATKKDPNWRIPTLEDFKALAANCVWIWCDGSSTKYDGTSVEGYIVYKAKSDDDKGKAKINGTWKMWSSSNSKFENNMGAEPSGYDIASDPHIFLPAAGYGSGLKLQNYSTQGGYWSSSLGNSSDNTDKNATAFIIGTNTIALSQTSLREYGYSIRPVTSVGVPPTAPPTAN